MSAINTDRSYLAILSDLSSRPKEMHYFKKDAKIRPPSPTVEERINQLTKDLIGLKQLDRSKMTPEQIEKVNYWIKLYNEHLLELVPAKRS